jgi:16S rRNA (guanine(966)-N(2))-methyltransferase RsmD
MASSIRITAGSARGRQVACIDGKAVRPTAARVREAIFSILGAEVTGARILDLFAGVGTLGLEALSRGAASACFVENNRRHAYLIHSNLEHLGFTDQASVISQDAVRFLGYPGCGPVDIVFVDPPYHDELLPNVLPPLFSANIIDTSGIVVVEHLHGEPVPEGPGWHVGRSYKYGSTAVTLLYPGAPTEDDADPSETK